MSSSAIIFFGNTLLSTQHNTLLIDLSWAVSDNLDNILVSYLKTYTVGTFDISFTPKCPTKVPN